MRKYNLIIAIACLGWTVKAQDTLRTVNLDEVVITGTKSNIPIEKSGKSIYKITSDQIERSSGKSVADLLNEVPGIQMDGNFGPLGTNMSYFVRGASSKRTLVLIDGIPFNDPSGIDQTYDLRLLDINQVESIEILKGGLSTLYGSGAAAGVINVTLKKPLNDSFSGNAKVNYGSFGTISPSVGVKGSSGSINYLINAGYKKSNGFSSALDEMGGGNYDDDSFEGYNLLGKFGIELSDNVELGLTTSLDDFDTDYDGGAFADGDNTSEYQQIRIGITPKYKWQSGHLKADIFHTQLDRLFDSPDFFDPTARFIDEYEARTLVGDIVLDQRLNTNLTLIGGLNYQKQAYSQPAVAETDFNIVDPYVSLIYDQSDATIQIGSRLNNHSEYGSNLVYNINPSYILTLGDETDLKLFTSYSTSFITPSLYQLYGPFGNLNLDPEISSSFEVGSSLYGSAISVNAAYFQRKDDELIDFRSLFDNTGAFIGGEYFNTVNSIEVNGIEVDANIELSSKLNIRSNYTYVHSRDDVVLFRIPTHKYGFGVAYQINSSLDVSVKHLHTGERVQPFFNTTTFMTENVITKSFDLVDLSAAYQIGDVVISGSINNVLDHDYVAILGFNTIGRNYNVGIRYDF